MAQPDFTFNGVPANFFRVAGATVYNAANSGVVTAVFPAIVSIQDIPGVPVMAVGFPTAGFTTIEFPFGMNISTSQYTGTVSWYPNHTVFAPETQYGAIINLTPLSGFTFHGIPQNYFSVDGTLNTSNPINSGRILVIYPETGSLIGSFDMIFSVGNISGKLGTFSVYSDNTWVVTSDENFFNYNVHYYAENNTLWDYVEFINPDGVFTYLDQMNMAAEIPLTLETVYSSGSFPLITAGFPYVVKVSGNGFELLRMDDYIEILLLAPFVRFLPVAGVLQPH